MIAILTRWRLGLSIAAVLAFIGLVSALGVYRHALQAERALRAADHAAYALAQEQARTIAYDALRATESRYAAKAREADHEHETALADARGAAAEYIRTHRVRGEAVARPSGGTVASAEGSSAGVRADLPGPGVVVTEADVQACTDWQAYGVKVHDWALSLAK